MSDALKDEIESSIERFQKEFNLPGRHIYKYSDGSGATGYINTRHPIKFGSGEALNVHIFGDGQSKNPSSA